MSLAEQQSEHRIDIEKTVIKSQLRQSNLGQIFAFIIGIAALTGATICILNGHDWGGGALGVGGLTGLVIAFIQGKRQGNEDRSNKK